MNLLRWLVFLLSAAILSLPTLDSSATELANSHRMDRHLFEWAHVTSPWSGDLRLRHPILEDSAFSLASMSSEFAAGGGLNLDLRITEELFFDVSGETNRGIGLPGPSGEVFLARRSRATPDEPGQRWARLFVNSTVNLGVGALVALIAVGLIARAIPGGGALLAPMALVVVGGGAFFLMPVMTSRIGDALGGQGTFRAAFFGSLCGPVLAWLFAAATGYSDVGILLAALIIPIAPAVGYEISSHISMRQNHYEAGLAPMIGSSAEFGRPFTNGAIFSLRPRF